MSTVAQPALLTVEEFVNLPHEGLPRELVRGKIVEGDMPGGIHGKVCSSIDRVVGRFVEKKKLGHVMTNDTFVVTRRSPDSVRGSDICFISYSRMPKGAVPEGAIEQPPELIFEVRSPSDRWLKVITKMSEYLEAGVSVVCIVDPKDQTVSIYRPDENAKILKLEDNFTLPDILPGFRVAIRKFFE